MKTLIAIAILTLSTIVMAQEARVIPVTVTGGTIEINFNENEDLTATEDLPAIMSQDGMDDEDVKLVTISKIRLSQEENELMMKKILRSYFYDNNIVTDQDNN